MSRTEDKYIVALDIGTSKVCTLVGEVSDRGLLEIIGKGTSPMKGTRRGNIINLDQAIDAVKKAVDEAEVMAGDVTPRRDHSGTLAQFRLSEIGRDVRKGRYRRREMVAWWTSYERPSARADSPACRRMTASERWWGVNLGFQTSRRALEPHRDHRVLSSRCADARLLPWRSAER